MDGADLAFVADYGTERKFSGRPPEELETGRFEIEYVEYDWTLNESPGSP